MKKKIKRICKRIIALFCLSAVLVSSCAVGVIRQEPKEVKAIAVVDDVAGAVFFELIVMLASLSAGMSQNDIMVTREQAGITDYATASDYVESSFGQSSGITNVFDFSKSNEFITKCLPGLAAVYLSSGYVLSKEWCQKVWSSRGLVEGSSALDFNPAVFQTKSGTVIQFPNLGGDDEGDNDDNGDSGKYLPPSAIPWVYQTEAFTAIYLITQAINREKLRGKLLKDPKAPFDPSVCDYSVQYWKGHNNVLSLYDSDFALQYNTNLYLNIYTEFITSEFTDDKKIYPLLYYDENVPKFCLSSDVKSSNQNLLGLGTDSGFIMGSRYWGTGFKLDYPVKSIFGSTISQALIDQLNFDITNRGIMDSNKAIVKAPNLIDCGTYENVQKFRELILTGNYTLDELLELMADGWKGVVGHSWGGIDDGGETAKKTLESEDGDKYKTKHPKTNDDVISIDSVTKGISNQKNKTPYDSTVREFIGDETSKIKIKYPTPGTKVDPGTNPDTENAPGTNPDTENVPGTFPGIGTNPGTGTEPGIGTNPGAETNPDTNTNPDTETNSDKETNPDAEGEPDDIDPEKTKTPELLKKFPFCVPWDLVNLIQNLSAEKKAPKFKIPFVLKNKVIDIDKNIVIDFSKWEYLAEICRWFFRIIFILALVLLTRNIIKG